MGRTGPLTIGIEEEYLIVDPETLELRARGMRVLHDAQEQLGESVQPELRLTQIETASPVCKTLSEVREQVRRLRAGVIRAAEGQGGRIVAAGTHPFSSAREQPFTPKERYRKTVNDFQELARELVIQGCHVHVGVDDPESAVQVMNRARVWLAPMLALSANSPFWNGADTGYDSYRTELWTRWPMAGQPLVFESRAEYDELIETLLRCGVIEDTTRIYWDMRLPAHQPTVEYRVTDVCANIDEAVMLAGLARALTITCCEAAQRDEPFYRARPELLKAAHWQAARHGLGGQLIDPLGRGSYPARQVIEDFMQMLRPALESVGDWDEVSTAVNRVLDEGNGAKRQREAYRRGGVKAVVETLIAETARGADVD